MSTTCCNLCLWVALSLFELASGLFMFSSVIAVPILSIFCGHPFLIKNVLRSFKKKKVLRHLLPRGGKKNIVRGQVLAEPGQFFFLFSFWKKNQASWIRCLELLRFDLLSLEGRWERLKGKQKKMQRFNLLAHTHRGSVYLYSCVCNVWVLT